MLEHILLLNDNLSRVENLQVIMVTPASLLLTSKGPAPALPDTLASIKDSWLLWGAALLNAGARIDGVRWVNGSGCPHCS